MSQLQDRYRKTDDALYRSIITADDGPAIVQFRRVRFLTRIQADSGGQLRGQTPNMALNILPNVVTTSSRALTAAVGLVLFERHETD